MLAPALLLCCGSVFLDQLHPPVEASGAKDSSSKERELLPQVQFGKIPGQLSDWSQVGHMFTFGQYSEWFTHPSHG